MNLKRIIATIITFLVALIIFGLSYNIYKNISEVVAPIEEEIKESKTSTSIEKRADDIKTVEVIEVQNKKMNSGFSVQGRLRAYDKTDLVAEIPGMMLPMSKRFKIGTRYLKDEVIFVVDDAEARLSIKGQKAQVHTAITQMMPDMKIDMPQSYNNWKNYLDQFSVNQSIKAFPKPLSDREEYYVSSKGLHAQYYNIKSAELRLSKYQVTAPFDGIITNTLVGESGYLRAGVSLGTIMNTSEYELEAAVPVTDLKYIKKGRSVKVVSDDSGKSWTGTVNRIGDLIDATTQTATVYISLWGKELREGQYLRAIINANSSNKVVEIPKELLKNKDKVFIIKDSLATMVPIQIVKYQGSNAFVKGLENKTLLVKDNLDVSMHGVKVNAIQ